MKTYTVHHTIAGFMNWKITATDKMEAGSIMRKTLSDRGVPFNEQLNYFTRLDK